MGSNWSLVAPGGSPTPQAPGGSRGGRELITEWDPPDSRLASLNKNRCSLCQQNSFYFLIKHAQKMDIRGLVLGCLTNFSPQGPGVWELQPTSVDVCYIRNGAKYQNSFLTSTFDTTVVPLTMNGQPFPGKFHFQWNFSLGRTTSVRTIFYPKSQSPTEITIQSSILILIFTFYSIRTRKYAVFDKSFGFPRGPQTTLPVSRSTMCYWGDPKTRSVKFQP